MSARLVELLQRPMLGACFVRTVELTRHGDRYRLTDPATGNVLVEGATETFLAGEVAEQRLRPVMEAVDVQSA